MKPPVNILTMLGFGHFFQAEINANQLKLFDYFCGVRNCVLGKIDEI